MFSNQDDTANSKAYEVDKRRLYGICMLCTVVKGDLRGAKMGPHEANFSVTYLG